MLKSNEHELLSEMMNLQKAYTDIESFCLHVNIYDKHGNFTKMIHAGTEFDFWLNVRKELEIGNSFGLVFNGDINESFEYKTHLSIKDIEYKIKSIFNDNFNKLHLEKINHFNKVEKTNNKNKKHGKAGYCGLSGMLFA
jgi:hypothetical protein